MKKIHTALVVVLVLMARRGFAQSAQQAQSLPVAELAHLVLGKVGSSVVAVDRPQWPLNCRGGGLCPFDVNEEEARGPAPLTEGMTFYQRPEPARGGLQWTGLCSSTAIRVIYDSKGTPGTLTLTQRFGLSNAALRSGYDHDYVILSDGTVQRVDGSAVLAVVRNNTHLVGGVGLNEPGRTYFIQLHRGVVCTQIPASAGRRKGVLCLIESHRAMSKRQKQKDIRLNSKKAVAQFTDLPPDLISAMTAMAPATAAVRRPTYQTCTYTTSTSGDCRTTS